MASDLYPEVVLDEVYFEVGCKKDENKKDIPGTGKKYPVFITLEHRYRGLEVLKDQGIKKDMDIQAIRKLLMQVLQEGMYNHDGDGVRTTIKDEFKNIKPVQVDRMVAQNLTDFWNLFLEKSDLVSKEKADELKKKLEDKENELAKNSQPVN